MANRCREFGGESVPKSGLVDFSRWVIPTEKPLAGGFQPLYETRRGPVEDALKITATSTLHSGYIDEQSMDEVRSLFPPPM